MGVRVKKFFNDIPYTNYNVFKTKDFEASRMYVGPMVSQLDGGKKTKILTEYTQKR